jgi:hypothetical protein
MHMTGKASQRPLQSFPKAQYGVITKLAIFLGKATRLTCSPCVILPKLVAASAVSRTRISL